MLKFKTSCAVLGYLSSNLLNEVGLSLFRYFEVGLRVCDIVVKKFTSAISSPDEFLFNSCRSEEVEEVERSGLRQKLSNEQLLVVASLKTCCTPRLLLK